MTTFVLVGGVVAADTRLTVTDHNVVRYDVVDKLSVRPWVATTGAGSHAAVLFLTRLPNLLAMRWLGVGLYPFLGAHNPNRNATSVLAVWRTGQVWAFDTNLHPWGCFVWARVRNRFLTHLDNGPVAKGGSGAEAFTLEHLEDHGHQACLRMAAEQDTKTGPSHTSFDVASWNDHRIPLSLRMRGWLRWRRAFQLWRTALTSADLPPHEAPHGHDPHTDGTGDHV